MEKLFRITFLASLVVVLAGVLSACDSVEDDEHTEVHGLTLTENGVEIYRIFKGQANCAQPPCGISVPAGEETSLVTVAFLDEEGDVISAGALDEELRLGHEFAAPSVAAFEQHDEDGKWRFHVVGLEAGETVMRLHLMHIDHPDFSTPPAGQAGALVVRVTQ